VQDTVHNAFDTCSVDLLRCHVLIVMCRPNTGDHCSSRCRGTSTDYLGYRCRRLQVRQDKKAFRTVTTIFRSIPVQSIVYQI